MRLLRQKSPGEFVLTKDFVNNDDIPPYAILSHTWREGEEVTFRDLMEGTGEDKSGHHKIQFCGEQAMRDGLQYFWVDTCCIDKSNSVELQEAINSMFRWYQSAARCYVYLSDVLAIEERAQDSTSNGSSDFTWELGFRQSRWFQRGWTLQELLAPTSVEFFSRQCEHLGDKKTLELLIHEITGVSISALRGTSLSQFSVDDRLSWARNRQTTRKEDQAYSLLGIFNVYMPLIYGEGSENAFVRLQEEIDKPSRGKHKALIHGQEQVSGRSQLPVIEVPTEGPSGNPPRDVWVEGISKQICTLGFHLGRVNIIPHFTPRLEYMEALQMLLPNASSSRNVFVLYGLGGIGKTQLAIKFAKDHRSEFTSTLFLDGSSEESLLKSFASIQRRIIKINSPHLPDSALLAKASQMSLEEMAQEVLQWLAQEHNNKWLLIFDNIDKEPLDEGGFDIMSYFPPSDHGSILITTRLAPLQRLGHAKKVGRMSEEEAVALLGQIIGTSSSYQQRTSPNLQQKRPRNELLETLDGLPLAISQAGQFTNTLNLTVETYMELYSSSKRDVIDMLSSDVSLHDAEKSSIRTTWTTSLNLLKEKALKQGSDGQYYAAYHLLQLFAYFEPSDLNYDIIRFGIIGNNIPDWFRKTFSSKVKFFGVIKILLDLCLIDNSISEGVYLMHRVVHDWLCTYVCWETNRELLRLAVGAISYAAPLYLTWNWFEEQQQLALHALHILPRLKDLSPNDFLVDYDKMTEEELCMVTSLLHQPVKCWKLLRYELTLMGISRLLQSRDRRLEALKFILDAQSGCLETLDNGIKNPAYLLLCYSAKGCSEEIPVDLLSLSDEFLRIGSPSWSIITLNLHALILDAMSLRPEAIKLWEESLGQSRNNTGSVFMHPTWMLFNNLVHRIENDPERFRQMFEKLESDAKNEKHNVKGVEIFLVTVEQMRSRLR